ncbi:hypothetical protein BVY03_05285 [bacterium K02(2017)]|nr:hypothetical protein BVY03_05285 [bacterium K02(2017)]
MKTIFTLAKKELYANFSSPIAYVFLAVFLFVSFWLYFSGVFLVGQASLRIFFGWIPLLYIILLPSVTMGIWAEERKTGSFELLLTMPVSHLKIILGKYLATISFLFILLLCTTPLVAVMSFLGELDMGMIIGAYLGLFLLGVSYLALGLFVSSLTKNQIVAFIVSVLVLFLFYVVAEPLVTSYLPNHFIPFFQFLSFNYHFTSMARGVIDTRDLIYFLSTVFLFLYLNVVSLSLRKVA